MHTYSCSSRCSSASQRRLPRVLFAQFSAPNHFARATVASSSGWRIGSGVDAGRMTCLQLRKLLTKWQWQTDDTHTPRFWAVETADSSQDVSRIPFDPRAALGSDGIVNSEIMPSRINVDKLFWPSPARCNAKLFCIYLILCQRQYLSSG